VILASGFCIGTLCAVDLAPGPMPSDAQVSLLEHLAAMVARFYEVPLEPDPAHAAQLNRIAVEAQEEFLSLISHELRTPLNGILGLAQVLEPADDEQAELIEAIIASGDHLGRIVESILAFTDLRSGDITLEEGPVDLAAVVSCNVGAFRKLAQISGKTLVVDRIADHPWITGDLAKLELALGCLVANFIAHGGDNGAISVVRQDDGELNIEVIDNGSGIAPERQAAIWRAFAVGAKPNERAAGGIGLGLPLANRAVELHGGELDLIPGHGTMSARIRLPAWRAIDSLAA
jgi:signal transduction histidine kinase